MKENGNKINFTVRQETSTDFKEIYALIKTAFQTAKVADGDEQDFAERLREGENYIPGLALVAEYNEQLIGHIMLTRTWVNKPDGEKFEALLLAPLSVLLEYREKGVGSALMKDALSKALKSEYKAVFLCGDPAYYSRFGFIQTSDFDIHAEHVPDQFTLVYELVPNALKNVRGIVDCC